LATYLNICFERSSPDLPRNSHSAADCTLYVVHNLEKEDNQRPTDHFRELYAMSGLW